MSDLDAVLLTGVRKYYSDKIMQHGPGPCGVDWGSSERQRERFRQITRGIGEGPFSLIDLGCGYGGLWDYLCEQGKAFQYLGLDISEEMISQARLLHAASPNCTFDVGSRPLQGFDHVIASGIFNVMGGVSRKTWESHVRATLHSMFAACEKSCAFNFLTNYADATHLKQELYYADPRIMLDFCITNLSPDIELFHHYGAWDFTIRVLKRSGCV